MKEEIELLREALKQSKEANKRIKEEARFNDYQKLQSKYYKTIEENKRLREALELTIQFVPEHKKCYEIARQVLEGGVNNG